MAEIFIQCQFFKRETHAGNSILIDDKFMKNLNSPNREDSINVQFVGMLWHKELMFRYLCIYIFHTVTRKVKHSLRKK